MSVQKLGSHMSMAGGHHLAVHAARKVGFTTVQVFTKSNNQWKAKPLTEGDVAAFRDALAETGVADPVGHNSYLINLASPDDALWHKSIDAMTLEVERGEALGLTDLVAHPGAHVGSGEEAGFSRIAAALDEVHRRTAGVKMRIAAGDHSRPGLEPRASVRAPRDDFRPDGRARSTRGVRGHLPYFRGRLSPGHVRGLQSDDRGSGPGRGYRPGAGLASQ